MNNLRLMTCAILMSLIAIPGMARAQSSSSNPCTFSEAQKAVTATRPARLVARIINPPRTRVTLSIDDFDGNHSEMVWDPAVNDGLQHSMLLLPRDKKDKQWRLSPSVEDDRSQSPQMHILYATSFEAALVKDEALVRATAEDGALKGVPPKTVASNEIGLEFTGTRNAWLTTPASPTVSAAGTKLTEDNKLTLRVSCEEAQVDMSSLSLNRRKVAAAAAARGLLDQTIPAPVAEVFTLLAEVAVDRAKAGAMEIVRKKFVHPMCEELKLETIGLAGPNRALPATCALVSKLRLEDVLSSGRSLVNAAKDDVRHVLAPALLDFVVTSEETRDLARIALDFGNRMIDGDGSSATAIDLLVALLDRLEWSSGLEKSSDLVFDWMGALNLLDSHYKALLDIIIDTTVPFDVSDSPDPKWTAIPECRRAYRKADAWTQKRADGTFPDGKYDEADRKECVKELTARVLAAAAPPASPAGRTELTTKQAFTLWSVRLRDGLKHKYFDLPTVFRALRSHAAKTAVQRTFTQYLKNAYRTDRAKLIERALATEPSLTAIPTTIENTCAIRLVVGVAKWCSHQESCSAGDIAGYLENPAALFKPTTELPDGLCWRDNEFVKPPALQKYIELGVRLVAFLDPPAKADMQARALEMVHWMFAAVRAMNNGAPTVEALESIVSHLVEQDYVRAMTEAFRLAEVVVCERTKACAPHPSVEKALQLVGTVVSYLKTREETKELDAEQAKAARKKAIESLIDAATDRRNRHGDTIYSIGSPVGFALGWRLEPGAATEYRSTWEAYKAYDGEFGFQWHLPLALARQRLPDEGKHWGRHYAFWLGDLGQFARSRPDGEALRWSDFLGLGLQAGVVIGTGDHLAVLGVEASWFPGQLTRGVMIDGRTRSLSDTFHAGLTFAYYVPFFDLN